MCFYHCCRSLIPFLSMSFSGISFCRHCCCSLLPVSSMSCSSLVLLCVNFPCYSVATSYTGLSLSRRCLVLIFFHRITFFWFAERKTISTAIMRKVFLYQVYTNLVYVPPTYRRVKKLRVLMINKNLHKSLASRNVNEIFVWSCNNPVVAYIGLYD